MMACLSMDSRPWSRRSAHPPKPMSKSAEKVGILDALDYDGRA